MNLVTWLLSIALLWICNLGQASARVNYEVRVNANAQVFDIVMCFSGLLPRLLYAEDSSPLFIRNLRFLGGDDIDSFSWPIKLPRNEDKKCIRYDVFLEPKTAGAQRGGAETRLVKESSLLTSVGDWLVRPSSTPTTEKLNIDFFLPEGIYVSTPWDRVDEDSFIAVNTPIEWQSIVTFSNHPPQAIKVGNGHFELSVMDDFELLSQEDIQHWVTLSAQGVESILGRFPVERVQIVVAPVRRGNEVVPWAYITRGGGAAVHLFVKTSATLDELPWDWSLPHEMSHFLLPKIKSRETWIIEGLPTYMQHIAMASSGQISKNIAWARLHSGFQKGSKLGGDYSVSEITKQPPRFGTYLRVYWGGAAYFFNVDATIRKNSPLSLAEVIRRYHECCYDPRASVSGKSLLQKFDSIIGSDIFLRRWKTDIEFSLFPDYESTFETLGLAFLGGNPIVIDPSNFETGRHIMGQPLNKNN